MYSFYLASNIIDVIYSSLSDIFTFVKMRNGEDYGCGGKKIIIMIIIIDKSRNICYYMLTETKNTKRKLKDHKKYNHMEEKI